MPCNQLKSYISIIKLVLVMVIGCKDRLPGCGSYTCFRDSSKEGGILVGEVSGELWRN